MPPQFIFEMHDVGKRYGETRRAQDISLSFYYGAKIGIVGENGSGKSTLLRIMAGIDTDIDGTAALAKNMRVRYVAQEPHLELDKTVRENLRTSMKPVQDLVDRFNEITLEMADPKEGDDLDKLMEEMGRLQEKIDALRRLGTRPPDGHRLRRPRAAARRHARAAAFRRRAPPRGPVHGPAGKARPAAPGRTDQPPRRRDRAVAGTDLARLSGHRDHRHARPLLPGQHHEVDPRTGKRPRPALRGQLLLLAAAEGRAAAGDGKARDAAAEDPRARAGMDPQFARRPQAEEPGPHQVLRAARRAAGRRREERGDHPDRPGAAAGRQGADVQGRLARPTRSTATSSTSWKNARSTCPAAASSA